MSIPRIYLSGSVLLENADRLVTERDLPGRQGRLAFVFLVANRRRPIGRGALIEAIWAGDPPVDVETSLSAILSKLRAALKKVGWSAAEAAIETLSGTIGLRLPSDTWVDLEEAANAIDQAEGLVRAGAPAEAWGFANVAVSITRRPFLPDLESRWIVARRTALRSTLTRGLQCLASISSASRQDALAVQYMTEILELEPFRETAYSDLMRLHASMGNRAEALRVFDRCRTLLRDELGASPSPQTEGVFLDILRAG